MSVPTDAELLSRAYDEVRRLIAERDHLSELAASFGKAAISHHRERYTEGWRDCAHSLAAGFDRRADEAFTEARAHATRDDDDASLMASAASDAWRAAARMARGRARSGSSKENEPTPVSQDPERRSGDPGPALPPCPTSCDDDCEAECHEVHDTHTKRGHQPWACEDIRKTIAAAVAAERKRICAVLGNDHYAIFTSLTWEVEHSTECALSGQVAECPHHKAIARIAEEHSEPGTWGRWLITGIDGEGLPDLERAEGETT